MNKKEICVLCSCIMSLNTFALSTHYHKIESQLNNKINNQSQIIQKIETNNKKLHENNEQLIKDKNKLTDNMKNLQKNLENTEDKLEKTEKQLHEKNKEIEKLRPSRGGNNYQSQHMQEFTLTFYTDLSCENSSAGAVNCLGQKLSQGMVANNKLPLGTKIYLEGYGNYYVADKGGSSFNNNYHLDVFVPRNGGESNSQYKKRVNNMGIKKVKGYIRK